MFPLTKKVGENFPSDFYSVKLYSVYAENQPRMGRFNMNGYVFSGLLL